MGLVEQRPDATLADLREQLGVDCALSATHKSLHELKIACKKRRSTPPSRTAPTWAKTNMTRLHGRASGAKRLIAKPPHGHAHTTTRIATPVCVAG